MAAPRRSSGFAVASENRFAAGGLDHRNLGLRRLQKEEKSFAASISMMIMENTMPPTLAITPVQTVPITEESAGRRSESTSRRANRV